MRQALVWAGVATIAFSVGELAGDRAWQRLLIYATVTCVFLTGRLTGGQTRGRR
jgi:hypothetical protein